MVKRAAGEWIQAGSLSRDDDLSWRRRIGLRIVEAVRSGELPPGSRLPSARQLARDWGLSRTTVDDAFAQLQADGVIERRVGNGSFVAALKDRPTPADSPLPDLSGPRREPRPAALAALERHRSLAEDPPDLPLHGLAGLALRPQIPDVSQFPLALWRRLMSQAHVEANRPHLSWGPAAGLRELREATAQYLALARGMDVRAEQVLIVDGPLQALSLIIQVLLEPGSAIGVCDPSHVSTSRFYGLMHLRPIPLPQDEGGLIVEQLTQRLPSASALMVAPACQYPLGTRLSPARRRALLDWAAASGSWIIEHEYRAELSFDGRPAPAALWAEDRRETVLLIGGYNPVTFPSLRMGYLVVPERLAPVFAAVRGLYGDHTNVLPQLAMSRFILEGHLAVHLRRLAQVYGERRAALLGALRRWPLLAAGARPVATGTNMAIHLPPRYPDRAVVAQAMARRVGAAALSAHAIEAKVNGLVLGFGADEPGAISDAIDVLGRVLHEMG